MKLPHPKQIKWNYTLLAFLGPIVGMFLLMIIRGFEPFGSVSMLYSDMYHQYYPFFVDFRRTLRSGDSLLYSWSIGMGMDYLGLISYYLASPLNLFSVVLPESWLLEYFSLLMPIKLGFASMFFAIFLKNIFHKNDLSITLFGCFYALCAWALGYQWNIMWLDTFALLPLVVLGTIRLLKEKKVGLYTFTLFLSIFTNYYIGLFTCIFVALVFFCYQICRWGGIKKFCCDLGRIALFSLLAIGMTAILELPALAALQTTQSSINKFPQGFQLNITDDDTWKGLLDAMRQVAGNMNGSIVPSFKEGLPNLYCGILTNILAILFLTCRQVKLRDKLCCASLLIFLNISCIIRQLDYIWHGFHFTNMIPYRFSFLYSFVMLYMAYQAWIYRTRFRLWQIILAVILAIGLAFCANDLTNPVYWAYNGVFLLLYLCALLLPWMCKKLAPNADIAQKRAHREEKTYWRQLSAKALAGIVLMELTLNLVNFGVNFTGTTVSNYPWGTSATASMIRYMEELEEDTPFYRAEATHAQTLNDGALMGYNGISTFTSSANVRVTEFMKALGYGAKNTYNRYCFEESSPVANLFLNLKYMIERQGKDKSNAYFDIVHTYQNVTLLENNAYLPLGFLAENQLINVDFSRADDNSLEFQNQLFTAATGISEDVWSMFPSSNIAISATGVTINPQPKTGYCSYTTGPEAGGTVVFKYIAHQDGLVCMDLNLSKKNKFSFWKNGVELYNETYSIPQSLSVCQVEVGDIIEVQLTCKSSETGSITIYAGIVNEDVFRQGYHILKASTLQLTTFENTRVEGTITCNRNGVLYTSIPQDGNWQATVDGKPAQVITIGDAMVALLLPEGQHTVIFTYHNDAFSLGWKISLGCLMAFALIWYYVYRPKKAKGKYEA